MGAMADADPDTSWQEIARHDRVMATIRDFTDRSGAVRVTVLLDVGEGDPPVLECEPGQPLTISQGEEQFIVPPAAIAEVPPLEVQAPRPIPATALEADADRGEVSGPIGAVEMLADGVRDLARALGGRTVAMAEFATRSGEPLSVAARPGESTVLAIGEHEFELPSPPIG
jgi:hypothetical protein